MGSGSFNSRAYNSFTADAASKSTDRVFSSRSIVSTLNPRGIKIRESRDSDDNPESTPIIIAIDVTGSMGVIADNIARKGLGVLFNEILERKPISNPHLMFMAVGDASWDQAPLQVSQFEADNRIVEQLTQIWIEKGGGGNNSESYNLPWYFAANHTEHDSFIKRKKRGYLFTIGDEQAPDDLTTEQIRQIIGDTPQRAQTSKQLLDDARRTYEVYHIIIEQGDYARRYSDQVKASWKKLMGECAISLSDYEKLAETIVGIIEVAEGEAAETVASRRGSVVSDAIKDLLPKRKFDLDA